MVIERGKMLKNGGKTKNESGNVPRKKFEWGREPTMDGHLPKPVTKSKRVIKYIV